MCVRACVCVCVLGGDSEGLLISMPTGPARIASLTLGNTMHFTIDMVMYRYL